MRTRWRKVTGKLSDNQISNDEVDDALNDFYQDKFPQFVKPPELRGWYEFNTSASTGSQDLPYTVAAVEAPAYLDGDRIDIYTDVGRFYDLYPLSDTTENQPDGILIEDRSLIIRQIPDDTYAIKIRKFSRPDALSLDADAPLQNSWALAIVYGSARDHMQEEGDANEANDIDILFKDQLKVIQSEIISQIPVGTRAQPRF